jgi:TrmH family RNA methyltransferase
MPGALRNSKPRCEVLYGRENRWLKRFRAALRGQDWRPGEPLGLEGPKLVEEALRSQLASQALLISESGEKHLRSLAPLLPGSTKLLRTSDRLFAGVSGTEAPQGVAALLHPRAWTFEDLLSGADSFVVMLCGVQDPGNVGTVVRTADALGATGLIATRGTAHPYGAKALRASSGSAFRLPLLTGLAPAVALTQLRVAGLSLIASTLRDAPAPAHIDFRRPFALLIGSEGAGLPEEVERSADSLVNIPIHQGVNSLNAAVAAAILLYEAASQRARAFVASK